MFSIGAHFILLTIFTLVPNQVASNSAQDEGLSNTVLAVSYLSKLERIDISTDETKSLLSEEMRDVTLMGLEMDSTNQRLLFSTMDSTQHGALYCLKTNNKPVPLKSQDDWILVDMSVAGNRLLLVVRMKSELEVINLSQNGNCSIESTEVIRLPKSPSSVTQDPCTGRVFWSNSYSNPGIHVLLPGDQSETIVTKDLYHPKDLLFNNYDRRLYWIDKRGSHWKIESSLWDGSNRVVMKQAEMRQPLSLAADRNTIYWTDFETARIWALRIPKDTAGLSEAAMSTVWEAPEGHPLGLAVLSPLKVHEISCQNQTSVSYPQLPSDTTVVMKPIKSTIIKSSPSSIKCDIECVHGACVGVGDASSCLCNDGYWGPSCNLTSCHNFCLNGLCLVFEGALTCSCHEGYFGARCEKNLCHNWCLNNGSCTVKDEVATCSCWPHYSGIRCEQPIWNNRLSSSNCQSSFQVSNPWVWATVTMVCICVLLILILIPLMVKMRSGVCRAPQIKKIISVKKPSYKKKREGPTDIEDCCNFNVCETPCDVVLANSGAKTEDSVQLLKCHN